MANIREVAKKASVSIATVSRVLNGRESVASHLRRRVLAAMEDCNYSPQVGRRTNHCLALVYAGMMTTASPYDSAFMEGIFDALEHHPFDLTILRPDKDKPADESYRRYFERKEVSAIILRCTAEGRDVVLQIAAEGIPSIMLGDHFVSDLPTFVYADSWPASREAVDYLCSLGHTRIAFAASDRDDGDHVDRYDAYRSVLQSYGLFDESRVWRIPPHRLDGAQLMRSVMGMRDRPTALFVADPLVGAGAVNEAHRMGVKIPDDISIISVDDTDTRNAVYPKLTAVCQDSRQLGRVAVERIVSLASGNMDVESLQVPPAWLEINNTTGTPPAVADRVLPNGKRLH